MALVTRLHSSIQKLASEGGEERLAGWLVLRAAALEKSRAKAKLRKYKVHACRGR